MCVGPSRQDLVQQPLLCLALQITSPPRYAGQCFPFASCSPKPPRARLRQTGPFTTMHNQLIGSTAMDQEPHLAQENTYSNENWVDMNSYHHQTTMPDYGSGYGYIPPITTHGLPSESLGRMPPPPPPPPQQPMPQTHSTHTQLPMLMMPHAWPSMLTNPNNYGPHSAPPVAIPAVTASSKPSKLPAIQTTSQPRKTLTDDDRRAMCQYAEDHPGIKQTEIGAKFGVERR